MMLLMRCDIFSYSDASLYNYELIAFIVQWFNVIFSHATAVCLELGSLVISRPMFQFYTVLPICKI